MPVADSAFDWQPVLSTKKMPSAHWRSGTRGRPPPKRWVFLCSGKSGSINAQSSSLSVKRAPVLGMRLARGRERGLTSPAVFCLAVFIPAKPTTKSVIRIGSNPSAGLDRPRDVGSQVGQEPNKAARMRLTDFKVLSFDCYGTLIDWETGISE